MKRMKIMLMALALCLSMFVPVSSSMAKNVSMKAADFGMAKDVSVNKKWTITLNKKVDTAYNLQNYISVVDSTNKKVSITIVVDGSRKKITVKPKSAYEVETTYTLKISKALKDVDGKELKDDVIKTFITEDANSAKGIKILLPGEMIKLTPIDPNSESNSRLIMIGLDDKTTGAKGQYKSYVVEKNGDTLVGTREIREMIAGVHPPSDENPEPDNYELKGGASLYVENTGNTLLRVYVDSDSFTKTYVTTLPDFVLDEKTTYVIQPGEFIKVEHVNPSMTHYFELRKHFFEDGYISPALKRNYYDIKTNNAVYGVVSYVSDSELSSYMPANTYLTIQNTFTDHVVKLRISKNLVKVTKQ